MAPRRCEGEPPGQPRLVSRQRQQPVGPTVTTLVQTENQEGRGAIIDSGMEAGMQDAMDLLEQVAISLLWPRLRITDHWGLPCGLAFRGGHTRGLPTRREAVVVSFPFLRTGTLATGVEGEGA